MKNKYSYDSRLKELLFNKYNSDISHIIVGVNKDLINAIDDVIKVIDSNYYQKFSRSEIIKIALSLYLDIKTKKSS